MTLKELAVILIEEEIQFDFCPSFGEIEIDILGDKYIFVVIDDVLRYIHSEDIGEEYEEEMWKDTPKDEAGMVALINELVDAA